MSASARWPSADADRLEAILCSRDGFCVRALLALEVQLCSQGAGRLGWGSGGEGQIRQAAPGTAGWQGRRSSHGSWAAVRLAPSGSPAGGDAPGSPSPPSPPILLLGGGERVRGLEAIGNRAQNFPRSPAFLLSFLAAGRRRLSCDPLVLPGLARLAPPVTREGRGAGTPRVRWRRPRPPDARVRAPAPRPDSSSRGDRAGRPQPEPRGDGE